MSPWASRNPSWPASPAASDPPWRRHHRAGVPRAALVRVGRSPRDAGTAVPGRPSAWTGTGSGPDGRGGSRAGRPGRGQPWRAGLRCRPRCSRQPGRRRCACVPHRDAGRVTVLRGHGGLLDAGTGPAPPRRRHPGGDGTRQRRTANPSRDPWRASSRARRSCSGPPGCCSASRRLDAGLTSALDTAPVREALAESNPGVELVEIGYRSGYPLFNTMERGGKHE